MRSSGNVPRVHWGAGEIGGPRHEYRESLLIGLIKYELEKGGNVLDAGCGSGSMLFKLADLGYMTYGVEESREYVEILRKKVKSSGIANVANIKEGNVVNIPFPDRSFDAVVSGEVLEHVMDEGKAVLEFFRVLKPGGICVISVPASPILWDLTDDWAGHLRRYTREGLVNLFEKKGFTVEDASFWGFPFVRLYHRFVYLPHIKRKTSRGVSQDAIRPPDAGKHQWMTMILYTIFKFDSLFRWTPFGIGLILKARRPAVVLSMESGVSTVRTFACPCG